MNYSCQSSGGWPQNFSDFEKLGFVTRYIDNNQMSNVALNIVNNGIPAIIIGYRNYPHDGHTWVVDGCKTIVPDKHMYNYFHMNFGWNGSDDGWFRVTITNFDVNGYDIYRILHFDEFLPKANINNLTYDGPNA